MAKVSPLQSSFNGGEFSPILLGRVDAERYKSGLATCKNYIPTLQGPLLRRPGTKYVAEVKDSTKATRLVPFEFSTTQAYIIEFGDQYFRFFRDNGQIESGGSPYEVVSPYLEADLFDLQFTQSADVLYIAHNDYAPRKLSRTGHTSWTLSVIDFQDGPYLSTNTTATTLTLSGTTGSVTVTASAATGINDGDGFQTTDIGRLIRWKDPANNWTWLKITARTSTTEVTATIMGADASAGTATASWRLGLWSGTTGYPATVVFHEDRLVFAGPTDNPQRFDGSKTGDYENFAPTEPDGTTADDYAIGFSLNASDVNAIQWLVSEEKGLLAGTSGAEWVIRPSAQTEALSPTNVSAKPSTKYGSARIRPLQVSKSVLFVQARGRKLREMRYFFDVDGFYAPDLSILAEHITAGGIREVVYQQEPQPVIWAVRNDGVLLGLTYERDSETLKAGWHRHEIGGYSDADHTAASKVESAAVIPSPDGTRDELWLVVNRYIDGGTKRYVEYMTKVFEHEDEQEDAFFVDCGATYDGTAATTISGLGHLEGETVDILADGAVQPSKTVSSGQITLSRAASKVHIGYGYNSDVQQLRIEAGAQDGTALGKTRRTHRAIFLFHRSLGLKIGMSFDNLTTLAFRTSADAMGAPPALFSGVWDEAIEADYDTENQLCWRQDQPLPSDILAVSVQMQTQDRG